MSQQFGIMSSVFFIYGSFNFLAMTEFIVVLLALLMFIAFYLRGNFYIKAYYLMNGKRFDGWLIPYMSISSFKESLLLIPFLPYLYLKNKHNLVALDYIKKGNLCNVLGVLLLVAIGVFGYVKRSL